MWKILLLIFLFTCNLYAEFFTPEIDIDICGEALFPSDQKIVDVVSFNADGTEAVDTIIHIRYL
jgi:hypothetical protein